MSRLICDKTFMIDKVNKGDFWRLTGFNFETLLKHLQDIKPNARDYILTLINNGSTRLSLSYINDKYISGNVDQCIEFVIKIIYLGSLTTKCIIKNVRTKELMYLMDKIALLFNINRIYLQDSATTLSSSNKREKIDFTLLTVMKENKTFYEKYGYETCNPTAKINLKLHKNLLRNFRFDIFTEYLDKADNKFITKTLKRLKKKVVDFVFLYQFYVESNEYYQNEYTGDDDYENQVRLQSILTNENYPWNSMVNIIQNQKLCMEKYF